MSCYSEYNFLKTGDILLCDYDDTSGPMGWFSWMIKSFTKSNYSHVAMVLKNPTFIHPSLTGLYVWESSYEGTPDPQDGKVKLGVQITPLGHFIDYYKKHGYVVYRKLIGPSEYFKLMDGKQINQNTKYILSDYTIQNNSSILNLRLNIIKLLNIL